MNAAALVRLAENAMARAPSQSPPPSNPAIGGHEAEAVAIEQERKTQMDAVAREKREMMDSKREALQQYNEDRRGRGGGVGGGGGGGAAASARAHPPAQSAGELQARATKAAIDAALAEKKEQQQARGAVRAQLDEDKKSRLTDTIVRCIFNMGREGEGCQYVYAYDMQRLTAPGRRLSHLEYGALRETALDATSSKHPGYRAPSQDAEGSTAPTTATTDNPRGKAAGDLKAHLVALLDSAPDAVLKQPLLGIEGKTLLCTAVYVCAVCVRRVPCAVRRVPCVALHRGGRAAAHRAENSIAVHVCGIASAASCVGHVYNCYPAAAPPTATIC